MTPQTPRPAPIATTNVCKIVIALPKIPYSFLNKRCFYGLSAFPPFPIIQTSFFPCFIVSGILFLSSLLLLSAWSSGLFLKNAKKEHIDGYLHALNALFILVFISSSCFSMIYSVLLLSTSLLLHLLHTPQILYSVKTSLCSRYFSTSNEFLYPHPPIPYTLCFVISYLLLRNGRTPRSCKIHLFPSITASSSRLINSFPVFW